MKNLLNIPFWIQQGWYLPNDPAPRIGALIEYMYDEEVSIGVYQGYCLVEDKDQDIIQEIDLWRPI